MRKLTLILVGDSGVGKTSLLLTFLGAQAPEHHEPTDLGVEEFVATVQDSRREPLNLSIWDTAGSEDYDRYRKIAYNSNPDVILLCFSIDNHDSLINVIEHWLPVMQKFCPKVPIILVGNKTDLRNDTLTVQTLIERGQIPIDTENGLFVQHEIDACAYFECSSKSGECVSIVFEFVLKKRFLNRVPKSVCQSSCTVF